MALNVLGKHGRYHVCFSEALGLIVERGGSKRRITNNHPQYEEWLDAFQNYIDEDEFITLCKAFLN